MPEMDLNLPNAPAGIQDGTFIPAPVDLGPALTAEDVFTDAILEDGVQPHIYRHRMIRRYMVGDPKEINGVFMFKNYELRISAPTQAETDARNQRFLEIMKAQPRSERIHIFKINTVAAAAAERPLEESMAGQKIVRGTAQADDLITAEDRARIKLAQGARKPEGADLGAGLQPGSAAASTSFKPDPLAAFRSK